VKLSFFLALCSYDFRSCWVFFGSVFRPYFFICFFVKVFLGVIRRLSFQKKWKWTNTNECNLLSDSIFDFEILLFLFLFICVFYLRLPSSGWPYYDLEWNHGKPFVLPCAFPCFFFESWKPGWLCCLYWWSWKMVMVGVQ